MSVVNLTDFDSAEGETVLKERALKRTLQHCVPVTDFEEFFSNMGVKEQYDAQGVLLWLRLNFLFKRLL